MVFGFIKFGKEQHLHELQRDGKLFCNSVSWFRQSEHPDRGDSYEGALSITQVSWLKIQHEDFSLEMSRTSKKNRLSNAHETTCKTHGLGNIFSLYAVLGQNLDTPIDEKMTEFGDFFLVVLNTEEFLSRLKKRLKELGLGYRFGMVNYYDEEILEGEIDLFYKRKKYSYQQEFRLFIDSELDVPFEIEIGNIEDISTILPKEELELVRIVKELPASSQNIQ